MALARPRQEPDDPAAAHLVEHHAVGNLVQPGAGLAAILERVLGPVRLDEGVLREVGRQIRIAHHPEDVRVDLAVVERKQLLDEGAVRGAFPLGAQAVTRGGHSALQLPRR